MHTDAAGAALLAHLGAACAYTGFQWTIAVLVYPQLAATGRAAPAALPAHEERHARRTARLVGPLFAALVAATAWTVATHPASALAWASGATTLVVLAATALAALPQHAALRRGYDEAVMRRLTRADAARTVAASVQVGLAVALVSRG